MQDKVKHILSIDDGREEDDYVAKAYKDRFPDAKFTLVRDVEDAIYFLNNECDKNDYPETLLFDSCQTGFGFDTTWGLRNALELIDWYLEFAEELPEHILFQSVDDEYVLQAAELFEKDSGIKAYAVNTEEYLLVGQYLGDGVPDGDVKLSGFRAFLNETLGMSIPETRDGIDQYKISNKVWREKDIVDFAERDLITREDALLNLHQEAMKQIDYRLGSEVKIDPEGGGKAKRQAIDLRFEFEKAVGDSVQGYAAFSIEDIEQLAVEDKKAVLFLGRYDARFVPHLKDLAAVALTTNNATGHMGVLLESHGVTGLLGSQPVSEHFNFLKSPSGQQIKYTQRLEGKGQKRLLASYNNDLLRKANEHTDPFYSENGLAEGESEPVIPELTVNIDELEPDHTLFAGDPVTVEVSYGFGSVYSGHHNIEETDRVGYGHWLNTVSEWLEDWHKETGRVPLKFKSNVDHPNQIYDSRAIGLLRTEHFILANADQCNALKSACLNQETDALEKITESLMNDLDGVFRYYSDTPVRIRLVDAPPSEFYNHKEQRELIELYGAEGTRGVQLAEQFPELYKAQLSGIFDALKKDRDAERNRWGDSPDETIDFSDSAEILVPTVCTAEELCFALKLTREAADSYGVPHDKYKFGSMLETVEACDNIEAIVEHCDFLSIGTNDLTSEVLGCARDDWEERHKFFERDGFDPFIQLHPKVLESLEVSINKARAVNPDIQIDLCGDHAKNIESLEMLRPLKLDGVSVPPNQKNSIGLKIQYLYNEFLGQKEISNSPIQQPKAHL